MVSVEEALSIVLSHRYKPRVVSVGFQDAVNKVLAEAIVADRDFPPFNRVAMDGIAVRFDAWAGGRRRFLIEAVQPAGAPAKKLDSAENCLEVMTGSMLPDGADTVIPYEEVTLSEGFAAVETATLSRGQHLHPRGQDAKASEILLDPGTLLSPAEIALLAAVGKVNVNVYDFPTTAIIATGDELVDVGDIPKPHQIRRSNTYAIQAAMHTLGWKGTTFHLLDDKLNMMESIRSIASSHQVIILSGGVSKGKYDFVPDVLEEIGVTKLFHRVNQKPGKPFWFGVSKDENTVFALPGNPVSTFMCFYRYIKPWLHQGFGLPTEVDTAVLATDFTYQSMSTYFLQVSVKLEKGVLQAYPQPGAGSGDFANLKAASGFLELPPAQEKFFAGEVFPYFSFR